MILKTFWIVTLYVCAFMCQSQTTTTLKRPRAGDPFDTFPKNFWQEFSSPFTDIPEEEDISITESTTHEPFPFFADHYTAINISIQLGSNVYLHCKVNDLQGKTVSWMRRKGDDLTLITFGRHTYSSDSRYSLEFEEPNNWKLCIRYANKRDEGPYECQVSSHPPLILLVNINVIVPQVEIFGEDGTYSVDKYYKKGSTIELQCIVSRIQQPSTYIIWKHGSRLLNYDTRRGGISVKTDLKPGRAISRLYIANANRYDSGNYTCMMSSEVKNMVLVHVLNEEEPAAMQHSSVIDKKCTSAAIYLIIFLLIYR